MDSSGGRGLFNWTFPPHKQPPGEILGQCASLTLREYQ